MDLINKEASFNKSKQGDENEYIYQLASYKFDYVSMHLYRDGKIKKLTFKEAELLKLFCLFLNNILSREYLLKTIWGNDDYFLGRSMDVYIARLRKYLKDDKSIAIVTFRSVGFKLEIKTRKTT